MDTCRQNVDRYRLFAKMWTDADNKGGQHRDPLHAKSNGMVQYSMVHLWSGKPARYFEAIKLALLSVWMIGQELIFWTLQTTADKRCGQMRTVRNNAEKCRQTAEKYGQTADMREWKCFDIERLCRVTYPYLRIIFTIFFSRAKVRTVHSTWKVRTCTFLAQRARISDYNTYRKSRCRRPTKCQKIL